MDNRASILPSAEQIRAARSLLGLSQEEIARLAGVSRRTIVTLERGSAKVDDNTMMSVIDFLARAGVRFESANDRIGLYRLKES
jgi:DNA-binding XRE family transcriptional regulator